MLYKHCAAPHPVQAGTPFLPEVRLQMCHVPYKKKKKTPQKKAEFPISEDNRVTALSVVVAKHSLGERMLPSE